MAGFPVLFFAISGMSTINEGMCVCTVHWMVWESATQLWHRSIYAYVTACVFFYLLSLVPLYIAFSEAILTLNLLYFVVVTHTFPKYF